MTADGDEVVRFTGAVEGQEETIPTGASFVAGKCRIVQYANAGTVDWNLKVPTDSTLDGATTNLALPTLNWVQVQNVAEKTWVVVASGTLLQRGT